MKVFNKKYPIVLACCFMLNFIAPSNAYSCGSAAACTKQLEQKVLGAVKREMGIFKKSASFMQWTFEGGAHGKPIYGGKYQLFNLSAKSGIARKKRRWSKAADLGWAGGKNITVKKSGRGPLRYGDTVALHLKNYGWLRYQNRGKRASGINLGAPRGNKFDWVIGGGSNRGIVNVGQPFTLKNKTNNRLVRHCSRSFGIDLDWSGTSCGSIWGRISNGIWGRNGSPNIKGRFCKGAIASGRVAAAVKTYGKSEAAGKVASALSKAKKACAYL